jgi:hypothetical protein
MGCCSGKNISVKENEESLLKSIEINTKINEEEYLNIIQSNINRVQKILSSYNKTDDIDEEDKNENNNKLNKKYFRFYIIYQLVLGKIKSIINDYINYKTNNIIKNENNIDFTGKTFNGILAKNYLDSLLKAEEKHNKKEVQELEKDMIKNIFAE